MYLFPYFAMLMSRVIVVLLILSLVCGAWTGRMNEVSTATVNGAKEAVTLILGIAGSLCLWSGVMEVMGQSGLSAKIARLLRPVIRLLFGEYAKDEEAAEAISQNMAANLLGLGNAATPAGLRAAKRLYTLSQSRGQPPHAVFLLIVINTSSIQLIPTTVAALRASYNSASPYDILPAVWLSSLISVALAVLAAKTMGALGQGKGGGK